MRQKAVFDDKNYYISLNEIFIDHNARDLCMKEYDEYSVFNIEDKIKSFFVGTNVPNSVDCILKSENFIEFKLGITPEQTDIGEIFEKIAFSLFVFYSETNNTIKQSNNRINFYLVVRDNSIKFSIASRIRFEDLIIKFQGTIFKIFKIVTIDEFKKTVFVVT